MRAGLITFTAVAAVLSCSASALLRNESAWNGHLTSGSRSLSSFLPFYVPPGSRSYDSSSPFVHYSGEWVDSFSTTFVGNTLRRTTHPRAFVTFTFKGTGVEWFGCTDSRHGISKVFLDGHLVQLVDTWSDIPRKQQRLFSKFSLPYGKHTLKIMNTGKRRSTSSGTIMDVDAFVVSSQRSKSQVALVSSIDQEPSLSFRAFSIAPNTSYGTPWTLSQRGTSGVHAMQLVVVSSTHALIVDKVEHNPLNVDGHPAWAALYNLDTHEVRPLSIQSNSFCAGGSFVGNGTLVNVGGNPVVEDNTSAADFGDVNGMQAVRIFEPCDSTAAEDCGIYENHARLRMAKPRWYNTVVRISDGSAIIIGGSIKGGWINNVSTNNPTVEYYPPKDLHGYNGLPIPLPFLSDTLNSNLFPIAFSLADGRLFLAANRDAMIYDWKKNIERRLPRIPNGVRITYPMTGTGILLPLTPDNDYTPEILLCGGSTADDTTPSYLISSQEPASAQCSRLVLTEAGIAQGWQVEQMPAARTMADAVLLPTGDVFIVNGAGTGISGYGNVRGQIGASNADHPVLTPVLYKPGAQPGARFSTKGMPASMIPRMYHSVATLTPRGTVMVAGSNPNLDRSDVEYGTEYRIEWFEPPYMKMERPRLVRVPKKIGFGRTVEVGMILPRERTQELKGTPRLVSHVRC